MAAVYCGDYWNVSPGKEFLSHPTYYNFPGGNNATGSPGVYIGTSSFTRRERLGHCKITDYVTGSMGWCSSFLGFIKLGMQSRLP